MRASIEIFYFYILKFYSLKYSVVLCLKNICCRVSYNICIYTINAVSLYHLWYDAMYKRQHTHKSLTVRKCMHVRASGASELRQFSHFHILKLLFSSIFCWYFRYFVSETYLFSEFQV